MNVDLFSVVSPAKWPESSLEFCDKFLNNTNAPKYVLGRNIYSEALCKLLKVDGIVDDYTQEISCYNLPIVRISGVPSDAFVINASGGRPLSAKHKLDTAGVRNLDYFAFYKITGLELPEIKFNEGFEKDFLDNRQKYAWIYDLLSDYESKKTFEKLTSFRFDYDIAHLDGFTQREDVQYFEDFLNLKETGETFVDVGAFDGFTSAEFIKRCPVYSEIFAFEPDATNFKKCTDKLRSYERVQCLPLGLSNRKDSLRFDVSGSASKISDHGTVSIDVDRLDDLLTCNPTFIKMDIEGGEPAAIEGASKTILRSHPRLAISVYHGAGDFWRIPEQVLSIRADYDIKLRHYTECIYETVMFFLPNKK
jgi:FkbM family methyltransferase